MDKTQVEYLQQVAGLNRVGEWTPTTAEYKRMEQDIINLMMKVHDLERVTGWLLWLSTGSALFSIIRMLSS